VVERSIDKVSIELSNACDLSAWISSRLNETSFNATVRKSIAAPCFAVTLYHFDAVLVLLGRIPKIYSPAFALMRLVFESYIRGLWFCTAQLMMRLKVSPMELLNYLEK
jgi:hypothetical protein